MTTSNKIIVGIIVAIVAVGSYIAGGSFKSPSTVAGVASTAGTTNSTQRISTVNFNEAGNVTNTVTATLVASLYNESSQDRLVTQTFFTASGALANDQVTIIAATTSSATATTSPAFAGGQLLISTPLSTTTPNAGIFYSSSTVASNPALAGQSITRYVWPAGTYINFISSSTVASATTSISTVSGVAGVSYLSL